MMAGEIAAWCALAGMGYLASLTYWRRPPDPLWPSIFFVYFTLGLWSLGEIITSFRAREPAPYYVGMLINYAGLLTAVPA